MLPPEAIGSVAVKVVKLIVGVIILIMYRFGCHGNFLGVGGAWDLYSEKSPDAEIIASGIFIGFFLYTSVILITYCLGSWENKKTIVEVLMNFVGMFMFIVIGAAALHYWFGYAPEYNRYPTGGERKIGLALGFLCILEGIAYLVDLGFTVLNFAKDEFDF
ncbi:hypothetical protein QAD02_022275 [Eretmocerus hayati]|uniref:Uncharacterized protein n=1 Tax=Eretmocerus hayati TaxID=131215 RepID=A0ACC2PSI0_9HYME|nr:hypothetical protein QAD02_022275 [Eretmocerus hayati]